MRNYLVSIFLLQLLTVSSCFNIHMVDFFAFFIPNKNIVICSDKKDIKQGPILNEIENEKGFTCLINLKIKQPYYLVTLHISKVQKTYSHQEYEMDVDLGEGVLYRNLTRLPTEKHFIIKIDSDSKKVFYLPYEECTLEKIEKCPFKEAGDSLFMSKLLKLNFSTRLINKNALNELNLIEKTSIMSKYFKLLT